MYDTSRQHVSSAAISVEFVNSSLRQSYQWVFSQMEDTQKPFVKRFYKEVYPKSRLKNKDVVWVAHNVGLPLTLAAVMRLQPLKSARDPSQIDAWFLTGLAVRPCYRHATPKLGHQLFNAGQITYTKKPVFCFVSLPLLGYYQRLGFAEIERSLLPDSLAQRLAKYSGVSPENLVVWRNGPTCSTNKLIPLIFNAS